MTPLSWAIRTPDSKDWKRLSAMSYQKLAKPHIFIWNGQWRVYFCDDVLLNMPAHSFTTRANLPRW